MHLLNRITYNPQVMGGKPCLRGMRITVGWVHSLLAGGATAEEIVAEYPYLEPGDIQAAIAFAATPAGARLLLSIR